MAFTLTGTLQSVGAVVEKSEYRLREFVILIEKHYKKQDKSYKLKFSAFGEKCDQFDGMDFVEALNNHMQVEVDFDINGKEYTNDRGETTIFMSLSAKYIRILTGIKMPEKPVQTEIFVERDMSPVDDLPF